MSQINIQDKIIFHTVELKARERYQIEGVQIITVITGEIFEPIKWRIKTFESSVYYWWEINAEYDSVISVISISSNDIILNKIDVDSVFWDFCRRSWGHVNDIFPGYGLEDTDLYRSNQIEQKIKGEKYVFNFWFCWKDVDCRIHNQHDFIEVHTNVAWDGFMQKCSDTYEESLIETVGLMPWSSHRRFDIEWEFEENGNPKYPFHRWLGWKTGNIWLAIEKYNNY